MLTSEAKNYFRDKKKRLEQPAGLGWRKARRRPGGCRRRRLRRRRRARGFCRAQGLPHQGKGLAINLDAWDPGNKHPAAEQTTARPPPGEEPGPGAACGPAAAGLAYPKPQAWKRLL
ncbi:uncharacterized protein LOC129006394 [Pongo pygmaeus]|uniref:uncharacterized protein LOC129006394 n=1 Tax=Pongo pygmaeus TaxID=9600 RepID=UPI0001D5F3AD|nr:uncharacterized protein LOC129006394 [Pongo pygmaeus]